MRFSVAVLKPAAWLLFGAAAIFAPIAAQALTFRWTFTSTYHPDLAQPTFFESYAGDVTFGATLVSGNLYQIQSLSGTFAGISVTLADGIQVFTSTTRDGTVYTSTGVPPLIPDNTFTYTTAGQAFLPATNLGVGMVMDGGRTVNWWTSNNNDGIVRPYTGGFSGFMTSSSVTLVPAPLPILALPAVLFYSRRIKKRLKQRSLAPVAG